jgi:hypothetical protein
VVCSAPADHADHHIASVDRKLAQRPTSNHRKKTTVRMEPTDVNANRLACLPGGRMSLDEAE